MSSSTSLASAWASASVLSGSSAERQERDEPVVGLEEAKLARSGPVSARGRSARRSVRVALDVGLAGARPCPARGAARGASAPRRTSGTAVRDRALDLRGDVVRLLERQLARAASDGARPGRRLDRDEPEVVHLADARHRERRRVHPLAQRGLVPAGSTWTTTSLPGSARCTAASTASAAAWPCPTAASGETPITTSAKCRPRPGASAAGGAARRLQPGDRGPRRLLRVGRRRGP